MAPPMLPKPSATASLTILRSNRVSLEKIKLCLSRLDQPASARADIGWVSRFMW